MIGVGVDQILTKSREMTTATQNAPAWGFAKNNRTNYFLSYILRKKKCPTKTPRNAPQKPLEMPPIFWGFTPRRSLVCVADKIETEIAPHFLSYFAPHFLLNLSQYIAKKIICPDFFANPQATTGVFYASLVIW